MEVKNEKKVMFKDMLPIEMHAIVKAGKDGRYYIDHGEWLPDFTENIHTALIYRTKPPKPKTITPNELYDAVINMESVNFDKTEVSVMACVRLSPTKKICDLIKQLEGFKDEA